MEILIDDASPQFEYVSAGQQPQGISGTWHNAYQSEDRDTQLFHRGTVYRSTGEGNQFIAHLNASSVRVFGSFYNNHGVFGAAIDGGQEVEKDGYTANRTMNAELASFDNLDSGRPHVLTLTNHPSRNERPDDARASQGWLDIDYLLLRHDVDGQIRTTRHGSDATAFQYTGDWQAGDAGARRSTKAGAAATLSFTGRSVQLFGSLGAEFGEYSIFLDGVEAYRRFNASTHVGIPDVALYTASGLEDGPHRLQIVNQGASGRDATIAVNYAIVNTTLPQDAPLSPVGGTTSSIAASGTSIVGMNPTSDSSSTSSMSSTLASLSTTATTGLITDTSTKGADPSFVYPPSQDIANDVSQGSHAPASGVIAGIVLGAAFLLGAILLAAWYLRRRLDWRERNIHAWTVATSPHPSQYDDKPTPTGSFRSAHKFYHRRESGASYSSRTAFPLLQVTNPSPAEGSGTESFRSRWSSIFAFGRPGRRGSSVSASVVPSSAAVGRWHRRGESELDGGTTDGWERMRDRSERASKASNPFTFDGMSEVQPPPTAMSRHPDALFFDVAMSGRQSAISAQASPMPMPRPRSPRVTTSSGSSNARLAYL